MTFEDEKTKFTELYKSYVKKIKSIKGDNEDFSETRSIDNFYHATLKLPWGDRNCLQKKEFDKDINYNLQLSRGMSLSLDMTPDEAYNRIQFLLNNIIESDTVRINELDVLLSEEQKKILNIEDYTPKSFFEIGYRIPRLQNFYKKKGLIEGGCDINDFNVDSGKMLGFNCFKADLSENFEINSLKSFNLIVCYHVIEHLTNPLVFLRRLYRMTSPKTLFHFEVPIEPEGPYLESAHLFAFHENDLLRMINMVGFRPFALSNNTHKDGPHVERVTFYKD